MKVSVAQKSVPFNPISVTFEDADSAMMFLNIIESVYPKFETNSEARRLLIDISNKLSECVI